MVNFYKISIYTDVVFCILFIGGVMIIFFLILFTFLNILW